MNDTIKTVNLFKPTSEYERAHMKLIITLFTIWVVAIFGFQTLLIVLGKPSPEEAYVTFESVWPEINSATKLEGDQTKVLLKTTLQVLGKNFVVKEQDQEILKKAFSTGVYALLPIDKRKDFSNNPLEFANSGEIAQLMGLETNGMDKLLIEFIPYSVVSVQSATLDAGVKTELPKIMELYLVHNRSVLTDTVFLGFPFHYWYTAQFLLIMFVVLCLIYSVITDKINKKYGIKE